MSHSGGCTIDHTFSDSRGGMDVNFYAWGYRENTIDIVADNISDASKYYSN